VSLLGIIILGSEPTSITKCTALLPALKKIVTEDMTEAHAIDFISPNILELRQLRKSVEENSLQESFYWQKSMAKYQLDDQFLAEFDSFASSQQFEVSYLLQEDIIPLTINLLPFFKCIIVKCGSKGTIIVTRDIKASSTPNHRHFLWEKGSILVSLYPPSTVIESKEVINVTGAGDSFVGVLAAGLSQEPKALYDPVTAEKLVHLAQTASIYSLKSRYAVSPNVSQLQLEHQ
jgi:pseudouridylate synthase / pseudouridine kinase